MAEDTNGTRTRAEKFKNYAFGIGACTALILGLGNLLFDKAGAVEDKADSGYAKHAKTINELVDFANKVKLKLVVMQAKQEERTSMKLFQKLEMSEKANKKLREQLNALATGKKIAKVLKPKAPRYARVRLTPMCKAGQVKDAANNCRWVPRSVAAKMYVESMKTSAAKIQLDLERKKRRELERKERARLKGVKSVKKTYIKTVPDKLDDVAQQRATVSKLPMFKKDGS